MARTTSGGFRWDESYESSADLSAKQFYVVKYHTVAGQIALSAAAGDAIGILQNDPNTNQPATVRHLGISKAVVDGNSVAIAIGDPLKSSSNGRLVKAATDKDRVVAWAEEASTADNVIISVRCDGIFQTGI